jgi:hypothetical protein
MALDYRPGEPAPLLFVRLPPRRSQYSQVWCTDRLGGSKALAKSRHWRLSCHDVAAGRKPSLLSAKRPRLEPRRP